MPDAPRRKDPKTDPARSTSAGAPPRAGYTGGCACGAVRYRAFASPLWSAVCACALCRKASGAPMLAVFAMPDPAFRWEGTRPRWFAPLPERSQGFCATCGTPLAHKTTRWPGETRLNTATLDNPADLPPTERLAVDTAPDWTWTLCRLPSAQSHPSAR